jgi:hypothetical protein
MGLSSGIDIDGKWLGTLISYGVGKKVVLSFVHATKNTPERDKQQRTILEFKMA